MVTCVTVEEEAHAQRGAVFREAGSGALEDLECHGGLDGSSQSMEAQRISSRVSVRRLRVSSKVAGSSGSLALKRQALAPTQAGMWLAHGMERQASSSAAGSDAACTEAFPAGSAFSGAHGAAAATSAASGPTMPAVVAAAAAIQFPDRNMYAEARRSRARRDINPMRMVYTDLPRRPSGVSGFGSSPGLALAGTTPAPAAPAASSRRLSKRVAAQASPAKVAQAKPPQQRQQQPQGHTLLLGAKFDSFSAAAAVAPVTATPVPLLASGSIFTADALLAQKPLPTMYDTTMYDPYPYEQGSQPGSWGPPAAAAAAGAEATCMVVSNNSCQWSLFGHDEGGGILGPASAAALPQNLGLLEAALQDFTDGDEDSCFVGSEAANQPLQWCPPASRCASTSAAAATAAAAAAPASPSSVAAAAAAAAGGGRGGSFSGSASTQASDPMTLLPGDAPLSDLGPVGPDTEIGLPNIDSGMLLFGTVSDELVLSWLADGDSAVAPLCDAEALAGMEQSMEL